MPKGQKWWKLKISCRWVEALTIYLHLTLSWLRSLSYRDQSIDMLCNLMDCFLYDRGLRRERVDVFDKALTEILINSHSGLNQPGSS